MSKLASIVDVFLKEFFVRFRRVNGFKESLAIAGQIHISLGDVLRHGFKRLVHIGNNIWKEYGAFGGFKEMLQTLLERGAHGFVLFVARPAEHIPYELLIEERRARFREHPVFPPDT